MMKNELSVTGELSFDSAISWRKQLQTAIAESDTLTIDLAKVSHSDSAGLALLIDATRFAKELNKSVEFVNMPAQMRELLLVCDLGDVLPIRV